MPSTGGLVNTSPILKPDWVDGVFDAYIPDAKVYMLEPYFPNEGLETKTVKWDERSVMNYGLTMPVAPMAESPIIQGGEVRQFEMEPAHFREKYVLREDEITAIRQLGTASETASASNLVATILNWGRGRIQDRMAKMRWDVMDGQIVISQNNVNINVPFNLAPYLDITLTGANKWDAPATAQPINDIINMTTTTRGFGFDYGLMVMNSETARVALQIQQFSTLFSGAVQGGALNIGLKTMDALNRILQLNVPGMPPILVYDGMWRETQPLTADAAAAATTIVVDDVTNFTVGQTITIHHKTTLDTQSLLLDGVTAATKTLSFTTTPLTVGYVAGSHVRLAQSFIKDGVVFFLPGLGGRIPSIGKMFMTPTPYLGGLDNQTAGMFAVVHDFENGDPPRRELIFGFSGMPVPLIRNTWAKLTVY